MREFKGDKPEGVAKAKTARSFRLRVAGASSAHPEARPRDWSWSAYLKTRKIANYACVG